MKKWLLLFLTYFFVTENLLAVPDQIEFIFLSRSKLSGSIFIPDKNITLQTFIYKNTAQLGASGCVPMGDGCFHPQYGIISDGAEVEKIEKRSAPQEVPAIIVEKENSKENQGALKTFNSLDVNLVSCDKGRYFDIFCGKSKPAAKLSPSVEVWVDTSSSLREVDYSKESGRCFRRSFISKIQNECLGSKVSFSVFDTSIKELGSLDTLCNSYGLNNAKKTIEWIERSEAKHLFVITDIDEYGFELRDYLDKVNAKIHGVGTQDITAEGLLDFATQHVVQRCR